MKDGHMNKRFTSSMHRVLFNAGSYSKTSINGRGGVERVGLVSMPVTGPVASINPRSCEMQGVVGEGREQKISTKRAASSTRE